VDRFNEYFGEMRRTDALICDEEISALELRLKTKFPDDFRLFLKRVDGYEGFVGKSYVHLAGVNDMEELTDAYCSESYPDKICIGSDGGGEVFVLDRSGSNQRFGVVPAIGEENDYIELGDTFSRFLDRLYQGIVLK